jgi:hypothetical protein
MESLNAISRELTKDKYLTSVLICVFLFAFIKTSNDSIGQLLVTLIGVYAGLTRASSTIQASDTKGPNI